MSKVTLHVLYGRVVLHVCGRCAPKRLECNAANAGLLSQWLEMPFQIISNAKRRTDLPPKNRTSLK